MTQHYPSTIRMDAEIIRDRQARERALNRDYMAWLRGDPEDEKDILEEVTANLARRDCRVPAVGDE